MYRERVWPTPFWFVAALLLVPGASLALAPINVTLGIVVGIALYLAEIAYLTAVSPRIEVSASEFRAGRGRIERRFLGEAEALDGDEAREALGPGLNARAWLCIRGWVRPLVKVPLNDPNDPTPYWLVSTRRPTELAAALNERLRLENAR